MNEAEETARAETLDKEIATLKVSYRFARREMERLQMAFEELPTSRIGAIKLRFSGLMVEIGKAITAADDEKNTHRRRRARDEA